MYPHDCKDQGEHSFERDVEIGADICTHCGMNMDEYEKEIEKMKRFVETFRALLDHIKSDNAERYASLMSENTSKMHRTNQQDFFRTLHLFIKKMVDTPTDMRNQESIIWCKKVAEIDANFPHI